MRALPVNFAQFAEYWTLDRDPFFLETSVPGVFAAGDVRHGSIKRVASSVGEEQWPSSSSIDTWAKLYLVCAIIAATGV